MHAQSLFKGSRLPALLAFGAFALTACVNDSDNGKNDNDTDRAVIAGRIQGDVEGSGSGSASGSGWDNTVVTTHTVDANGTLSAAHDSATANSDGTYLLETDLMGNQEIVLRGRRADGTEWMTRFAGNLKVDQTSNARPMNLESTLESAVWLELKKSEDGRDVHSSEVNVAIDAKASADARGAYRGAQSARADLVARLAASINAASDARRAFLAVADSQWQAHRAMVDTARVHAQVEFDAALSAAAASNDTGAARAAERAYVNAMIKAYLDADVQRTAFARSAEASYHAMVRASATLSDSARTAMARNYARILVIASDTAMRHEFREAGASQARLNLVADAGARFKTSIDTASTRARFDSAVVRFRSDVAAAFNNTADTGFTLFSTITSQLNVKAMLDSASTSLVSSIGSSVNGQVVGDAYAESHLDATASLLTRFEAVNNDDDEARAAANVGAFVWVRSSHD